MPSQENYIILVIDDEPEMLHILGRALKKSGYQVSLVQNIVSAMRRLQTLQPHLILLDVMMPEMNGFDALKCIKANARSREIPIILMTALADTQSKVRGLSSGAVDYIIKPFDIPEVLSRIKLHINLSQEYQFLKAHRNNTESLQKTSQRHITIASRSGRFLEQYNQELDKDHFTGLPSYLYFNQILKETIGNKRENTSYSIILVGLNSNFDILVDSLKETERHRLYRNIAHRFRIHKNQRIDFLIAEYSPSCLMILLAKHSQNVDLKETITRFQTQLQKSLMAGRYEIYLNAYFGVIENIEKYVDSQKIVTDAKIALNFAKRSSSGQASFFNEAMRTSFQDKIELDSELRRALKNDEFRLYYQPIIRIKDNEVIGFEALIRWQHPQRGLLTPGTFIFFVEQTDLIHNLGLWVLREACSQMVELHHDFPDKIINVNLSARQLSNSKFVQQLQAILQETQMPPHLLKLELTETCIWGTGQQIKLKLDEINALGIKLCLDDFGVEYSSLSRLQTISLDTIKIDRSFVSGIFRNSQSGEILSSMINLARRLEVNVVAEGIETDAQLLALKNLGCAYGQGYFFSPPMGYEDLSLWLTLHDSLDAF